jgi:Domain of unknown function (DUF6429)
MHYDEAKIDEAVLAVLYLTAWEEQGLTRAWKGIDWDASNRLHERGLIDDPKNKNKSVIFTEEGLALARAAAERLFSSEPHDDYARLLSNHRLERVVNTHRGHAPSALRYSALASRWKAPHPTAQRQR